MTTGHVRLTGVSVTYPVHMRSIGRRRRARRAPEGVRALKDIELTMNGGERIGLIGLNGSGKTTMLRVIGRILTPQRGHVDVSGRVCPLFEFATGFEMDASGWDNIRTRALLLGMPFPEIESQLQEIGDFTELGRFLDLPVRTYSSGMLLRLAFATSTAVAPDILLLDEVMATGDAGFVEKARRRMESLIDRARIVVFATHALQSLPDFCSRSLWLHRGRIRMDGPTGDVVDAYLTDVRSTQSS